MSGKRALLICGTALIVLGSISCRAEGFVFEVDAPKFKISIPGIPRMKMDVHPKNASQPQLRFLGTSEHYTIAIFTPTAAGMTPLECAGAITRTLAARAGTPPPSQVLKTRLDDSTFLAVYAVPLGGGVQLHAHILSAAGGTHCVEIHTTKISIEEDDLASWITDLEKASIKPN